MEPSQQRSKEFMSAAGQKVRDKPTAPPFEERLLRGRLTLEETLEFIAASGLSLVLVDNISGERHQVTMLEHFELEDNGEPDLVGVADAIGDISYVNNGAANTYGIDMEPIDKEIHESNMAKFGPGSSRDEYGKVKKPIG